MPKKYFTTTKAGEEVEVSPELAKQLVKMGKKKPDDFTIEELPYSGIPKKGISEKQKARVKELRDEYKRMSSDWNKTIGEAKRKSFQDQHYMDKLMSGVGKTAYSTFVAPYKQLTGKGREVSEVLDPYQQASEGSGWARAGEIGADIGLALAPAGIGAKAFKGAGALGKAAGAMGAGLGSGLASAGQHQLQRYGETGQASLGEGLAETGLSTVIPGFGYGAGQAMKKAGPEILRQTVKPIGKFRESVNPPNFVKPLQDKLIQRFGGLEAGLENVTQKVKGLANKRDDLIKDAGIKINITDAVRKTGAKLNSMVGNEIDASDAKDAFSYAKTALATATKKTKTKPSGKLSVSGSDAIDLRKLADKQSRFNPFKPASANPNKVVFNEAYRRVLEDETEKALAKKSMNLMGQYKNLKSEMANLIPFQKAAEYRLGQMGNNYSFSLMDLGALGVGGTMGAGLPMAQRIGAAGLMGGFRRMTATPGGARMTYGTGEMLTQPGMGKDLLMQIGRSNAFGR